MSDDMERSMETSEATGPRLIGPHGGLKQPMPSPTAPDLASPLFNAIWNATKTWDVNAPEYYVGYCGMNGSHVMLILLALRGVLGKAGEMPEEPPLVRILRHLKGSGASGSLSRRDANEIVEHIDALIAFSLALIVEREELRADVAVAFKASDQDATETTFQRDRADAAEAKLAEAERDAARWLDDREQLRRDFFSERERALAAEQAVARLQGELEDARTIAREQNDLAISAKLALTAAQEGRQSRSDRDAVLEEAAATCEGDNVQDWTGGSTGSAVGTAKRCAAAIRALKDA